MNINRLAIGVALALSISACSPHSVLKPAETSDNVAAVQRVETDFRWRADRFADIQLLRYQIPKFETLTVKQKERLYYLSQAARRARYYLGSKRG